MEQGLYIVPTPIGNIEDITLRAVKTLTEVDFIACEDTRHTGKLMKLLEIPHKNFISYHNYNEAQRAIEIVEKIKQGASVALVSDAGTPCISDPGYRLVSQARKENIPITALPGASAAITALSASGFPTDSFHFLGFPPQKKGRKTFLENLKNFSSTIILYESPYRVLKLINELIEQFGEEIEICLAREISKIYEEYIYDNAKNIKNILEKKTSIKGEFVILLNMNKYNKLKK